MHVFYMAMHSNSLVRLLVHIISPRIIVARNDGSTIVTPCFATSNSHRLSPNNLSIVTAFSINARVRSVVIVSLLVDPKVHGADARKVGATPGQVLSIRPTGVYESAVAS